MEFHNFKEQDLTMSDHDNKRESEKPDGQVQAGLRRKPYKRPILVTMGNLRDLTMGVSGKTVVDGMPAKTGRGARFDA